MKSSIVAAVGIGLALASAVVGQDTPKPKAAVPVAYPSELKDLRSRASYSLGLLMGKNLKIQDLDVQPEILARGINDALAGGKVLLTEAQVEETMKAFQQQVTANRAAMAKVATTKNQKEGEAFLAANKTKPGVVSLPSGLQYKEVKKGTGKTPKATDSISAHYRGTLLDGTEFDSSYKRGQPATFPVNGVIKGWTEALLKMKVGDKWQLFIPADLAYGASPPPGSSIGPNAVLLFDIELINVE